jgi:peptidoglycan L-alanyl-D-glutamate endopeptidase CwlK
LASRKLDDLNPAFKLKVFEFLARLNEAGIHVMIVETSRTLAEHLVNVANGKSWTKRSKHIDGLAIDICPYELYALHGTDKLQWDNGDPIWPKIGAVGESLGMRWGGRWQQKDMGHFEETANDGSDGIRTANI